jgi:hypothetical protein
MNYEAIRKQQQHDSMQQIYLQQNDFAQFTHLLNQNQNEFENQYFTHRQYRRKRSFNRREDFRSRNNKFQARRLKKCFVCEKIECWSINHFEKKRNDSKKRFSDRYFEYKIRSDFDRWLNQYIADFEDTYDSDDEYAAQYFDELTISSVLEIDTIKLIEFESDELFLISFDELSIFNIELIINAFANKTFQHRLIFKNMINALINESFDFTYISITDSRYDDTEFKDILVNCDVADRSTNDMSQFKALQRISNEMSYSIRRRSNQILNSKSTTH